MKKLLTPGRHNYRIWQIGILIVLFLIWHFVSRDDQLAFFFGEPLGVFQMLWKWFVSDGNIYKHLGITLSETLLAFVIGTIAGMLMGLWMGLSKTASLIFDPYLTALNSMPRVILAPIFAMWFGLGIWSKVALAFTLVFFIVFFNVYQGIREVSPTLLDNARMLGANRKQLLRYVYLPSATSWVFSSLHASVGLAFVGAVVGEYLGSASGVGYLILQAEGSFDVNTVYAGIITLTICALLLDALVGVVERYFQTWKPGSKSDTQQA
ncbi:ABC transporter permease [Oligella urethralis]|uniref:ABC transporter permease n=1 Tax=Oligella urethralis TaxID=90245 RepID=UPI000CFF141C|nr:ABC transporter permease [Oligella urethralis]AVL71888.1 ABC transporter permease [Oligella urethralis]